MTSNGVTEHLLTDHSRLERLFSEARRAAAAGAWPDARRQFSEFERGMLKHIELEESLVFPLFEQRTRIVGPLPVMRDEHRLMQQLVVRGAAELTAEDAQRFEATAGELAALNVQHCVKERAILYAKTDRALSEDERRELVRLLSAT